MYTSNCYVSEHIVVVFAVLIYCKTRAHFTPFIECLLLPLLLSNLGIPAGQEPENKAAYVHTTLTCRKLWTSNRELQIYAGT